MTTLIDKSEGERLLGVFKKGQPVEVEIARSKPSAGSVGGSDETPIGAKWWPSKWGANDQRGAANLMTPEKVLEAQRLIRTGKVYQLELNSK